ncbi:MAG TPA: hypothetical protein VE861_15885 [Gemmatimonadaceae bacterium]|nr:hypothetical protein [Gemmatimonadaceae bacterium]
MSNLRQLLITLTAIGTTGLHAQSSPLTATAAVITSLTVTGTAPLDFGTIPQGVNRNVQFNAAGSGRFRINGLNNSQVLLTFTLPATLSNGAATLPISNYNVRVNDTNTPASARAIVAISGIPALTNLVAGALYVFIGARVSTAPAQAFGTYTGSIVLSAAYTGL